MGRHITKEAGFTLVEILLVLAILAVTTSVVILSIPQEACLLYTSPSPRDRTRSRMPSSA